MVFYILVDMAALGTASKAIGEGASRSRHLWMHFAELGECRRRRQSCVGKGRMSGTEKEDVGTSMRLSSLYCVNVGHGRAEIADAVAAQIRELEYFPVWRFETPPARALSARIAALAPAGLNWVFFTSGGSESVATAWKMTRQYHRLCGNSRKTKIVSALGSYHGTTMGALSITGNPSLSEPFMPLVPGVVHAPKVDPYHSDVDPVAHSLECAEAIARLVEQEDPDTVGAVIVEPVQNSGGCLVAEPIYFERLREICDEFNMLLISDETICSWGRIGTMFGCERLDYVPDLITTAKGLTSGYIPMGAVIASDRVAEPFLEPGAMFAHGLTFGGHPATAAAALANLEILEREDLCSVADAPGAHFLRRLQSLLDLPIVGDVRGVGLFAAVGRVDRGGKRRRRSPRATAALTDFIPDAVYQRGMICRAMHRGTPGTAVRPYFVSTEDDLDTAVRIIRDVLLAASEILA